MSLTYAEFKNEVKTRLTDKTINDDTGVRALGDFVKAKISRDLIGNKDQHDSLWVSYMEQRRDLLGFTITLDDATLKARVRAIITDATIDEDAAIRAVADFVKSRIADQVDHDPQMYELYDTRWKTQRNRLLGYAMTSDVPTIRTAVNFLITVDADRQGITDFIDKLIAQAKADIGGLATWLDAYIAQAKADLAGSATRIDKYIRDGVRTLQEHVEFYRFGHETNYEVGDLTAFGEASLGILPEGAQVRDVAFINTENDSIRKPVLPWPWDNRSDLVMGAPRIKGKGAFQIVITPQPVAVEDGTYAHQFVVWPGIIDGYYLAIAWDGIRNDFADGDVTPFDEQLADACASYVQWQRGNNAEKDNFGMKQRALYRSARERTGYRNQAASPQPYADGAITTTTGGTPSSIPAPAGCHAGLRETSGNPEGVLTGCPPDLAYDPATMIMYIKQSGVNTNTGWREWIA